MAADRNSAGLTRREGPVRGPGAVPHDAHDPASDEAAGDDEQEAERDEADARRRHHGETCPERGETGEGQPQDCGCASPLP